MPRPLKIGHRTPKTGTLKPISNCFKAQMDVYGHKFVLVVFGEFTEDMQKSWFNSIMEVLKIGNKV